MLLSPASPHTDLRESVSDIQSSLATVYSDKPMCSTCFHLHAVLVHQGQASAGHYWAYIRKPQKCGRTVQGGKGGGCEVTDVTSESHCYSDKSENTEVMGIKDSEPGVGGSLPVLLDSGQTSLENRKMGLVCGQTCSKSSQTGSSPQMTSHAECVEGGGCEGVEGGGCEGGRMEVAGTGDVWLKFNDVSVSEVGWEEVRREGVGGKHNTSAYCLVYINSVLYQDCRKDDGEGGGGVGEGLGEGVSVHSMQVPAPWCQVT